MYWMIDTRSADMALRVARDKGRDAAGHDGLEAFSKFVYETTFPYVPFLTGLLEGSILGIQEGEPNGLGFGFHELIGLRPTLRGVEVWFSAKDETGYDYAEFQHDTLLNHPIRAGAHTRSSIKRPTVGFLALGLAESASQMEDIIAKELREVY